MVVERGKGWHKEPVRHQQASLLGYMRKGHYQATTLERKPSTIQHPSKTPEPAPRKKPTFTVLANKMTKTERVLTPKIIRGRYTEQGRFNPKVVAAEEKTKEPWEMTKKERDIDIQRQGASSVDKWNRAGNKGFPPSNPGLLSIGQRIAIVEQMGLKPKTPEFIAAAQWPQHKLEVAFALSKGKSVPASVLAEYPDLATPQPIPRKEMEALLKESRWITDAYEKKGREQAERDRQNRLMTTTLDVIKGFEREYGTATTPQVLAGMVAQGYTEREAEKGIEKLKLDGHIFEPKYDVYKST